jgi:hypothetical protein
MGTWLWANILLALLFFGCWAGIPLWLTLNRWNREIDAKHAELAAKGVRVLADAQPTPATVAVPRQDIPEYVASQ